MLANIDVHSWQFAVVTLGLLFVDLPIGIIVTILFTHTYIQSKRRGTSLPERWS